MDITNETIQNLIKSINDLSTELKNIDRRVGSICDKPSLLIDATKSSAGAEKEQT